MLRFYKAASAILLVVVILEGFLLYRLWTGKQPPEPQTLATRSVEHANNTASAVVPDRPSPLRTAEQPQAKETTDSVLARLEAGKNYHPMFDRRTGRLHEKLLEELGCSSAEREALESLFASTRRDIDALLRKHATVTEAANGRIDIAVTPFVEDGARLYDGLAKSLETVLGQERTGALMEVRGRDVERQFGQFGAAERNISITQIPQNNGAKIIAVTDQLNSGEGHGMSSAGYHNYEMFERNCDGAASCLPEETRKRLGKSQGQPQVK